MRLWKGAAVLFAAFKSRPRQASRLAYSGSSTSLSTIDGGSLVHSWRSGIGVSGTRSLVLKSAIALFAAVAALAALNMIWSWERLNKTKRIGGGVQRAQDNRCALSGRALRRRALGTSGPNECAARLIGGGTGDCQGSGEHGSNPQWLQAAAQAKISMGLRGSSRIPSTRARRSTGSNT